MGLFEHQDKLRVALGEVLHAIRTGDAFASGAQRHTCVQRDLLGDFEMNPPRGDVDTPARHAPYLAALIHPCDPDRTVGNRLRVAELEIGRSGVHGSYAGPEPGRGATLTASRLG
jgi:hypothetical protein